MFSALCLFSLLSAAPMTEKNPTFFIYNGQVYYDDQYWYGPGWYYGRWYGSKEPYWIWRRRYPYWWNRVNQQEKKS